MRSLASRLDKRLVHQHQRRLDHDRARDGHALLLSARKLAGQLVLLPGELHELQCMRDARRDFGVGQPAHLEAEADVLRDRHVRKQRVVLEHHAEAALFRRQRVDARLVEPDAAARQLHQAGDAVERRRLAAAGRPEQRDEFAALDRERQLVQRGERVSAGAGKAPRDAVQPQFVEIVVHRGSSTPRSFRLLRADFRPSAGTPRRRPSRRAWVHADIA